VLRLPTGESRALLAGLDSVAAHGAVSGVPDVIEQLAAPAADDEFEDETDAAGGARYEDGLPKMFIPRPDACRPASGGIATCAP
jgi:hypothetical protein